MMNFSMTDNERGEKMVERRKLKRRHVIFYSRVFDCVTGILLGHLVDITPEGFMLISEDPIQSGSTYKLRMDLPDDVMEKAYLNFEAKCLWCQHDVNPSFHNAGFMVLNMSSEDKSLIENMIEEYGFRD
jgi:hypothetical protein